MTRLRFVVFSCSAVMIGAAACGSDDEAGGAAGSGARSLDGSIDSFAGGSNAGGYVAE